MQKREHFEDTISDANIRCALGINKKTGRLQWCPGYCNLQRMMIAFLATIIPIIIIFLLFNRLDIVEGVAPLDPETEVFTTDDDSSLAVDNQSSEMLLSSQHVDPRCRIVKFKFGLSETLDTEERDPFKDTRTSFIPSDLVMVPPNCQSTDYDEDDGDDPEGDDEREVVSDDYPDSEYRSRPRRSGVQQNLTAEIEISKESEPWNNDCPPDTSDDKVSANCDDSVAEGFHAFWKGEGSPDKIRATQAEVMKQYMDTSVDPCIDYYQYACGNWEKLNPIPKDRAAYDTFEMLRESLDFVLQDLLKAKPTVTVNTTKISHKEVLYKRSDVADDDDSKSDEMEKRFRIRKDLLSQRSYLKRLFKRHQRDMAAKKSQIDAEIKAKHLYESCLNYELIARRGIKPLVRLLENLGGWPVLDSHWREDKFDWLNLTANLRLYNNDIFLAEWVGPDIKNSEENVIQFDQTSLGLPTRDYFLQSVNQQYLEAYEEYMTSIIVELGGTVENAKSVAKEVVDFETELARITSSSEERTNVSLLYKRMTLFELHQQIPEIDWTRYLITVLDRPVNVSETVVMFATNFMRELVKLLDRTDKRTTANYLFWRFVRHRINNLDDRFQDAKQKFYKVLFGREKSPPRWKVCVSQVNSNLGMAVGAMFVRKYFDENSKNDTLTMTHELQEAFREILNETSWIEDTTKGLAELKVNEMSLKIGFPDYILSPAELNEKYADLEIDPRRYFENTLNVLLHLTRSEQEKLGQVVNKTVWHTAPAVVNAYYSRNKNQIMFPAGILQPPFYHRHFPKSLNFGGIGVVIGHELTHGFDDKGRLFDHDGNLHRWWTDADIDGFNERARCLIAQYGKYIVQEVGIPVDGENTQGENIADNGGIKQAFRAYEKWLLEHPENIRYETLPGLNATHLELFFLNFAQVWCGAMRPEATRNKLKTAVHSPGKFRVIGTLSNSEDFIKVYKCPRGSPMNPVAKCGVW